MIPYKQLTLAEVFEDCQNKFDNDKYQFLSLLDQTINLDEIVPVSFVTHFHASTGRPRKHPLYPMIKALLIPVSYTHLDVYKRQLYICILCSLEIYFCCIDGFSILCTCWVCGLRRNDCIFCE